MKKLLLALLVVTVISVPALAADSTWPSPFPKLMELCLAKGQQVDIFGSKLMEFDMGSKGIIRVVYVPQIPEIGIGYLKPDGSLEAVMAGPNGYTKFTRPSGNADAEPTKKLVSSTEAQETAYKIFRVLVENKLV